MSKSNPAFQFYPGDWLKSQRVALMSLEEEGAYIRLLCYCWTHGSIPSDTKQIRKLIGKKCQKTIVESVIRMFEINPENTETLIHPRLAEEKIKQVNFSKNQSLKGKRSSEKRWSKNNHGYNSVTDRLQPEDNSSSSTSVENGCFKNPVEAN